MGICANSETLQRWHEHLGEQPDPLPATQRDQVFCASEFVAQAFLRDTEALLQLCQEGDFERSREPGEMAAALVAQAGACEEEDSLERVLRQFRNRQMVRIIWRDICGLAELSETLEDLSELADVCIREALHKLYAWETRKSGVPRDFSGREQKLVILGMGKLGARELNMSSDIDLIYCYPSHGHTDGRRELENETFFTRLGRKLANVLSRQTVDGFVYRVDLRLRPFGESGPLVVSLGAMEQYLQGQAREWERYAMVKARAITGEPEDIAAFQSLIKAFVYRRYIDFGVIESIRDMKRMIVRELHKKGMDANIKLGMGGIREIEFLGQAFQLVRGGRNMDLQIRPIQQVLDRLGEKGLLPDYAVRELQQAYVFLRRAENRIQAWKDEQTHLLPQDEDGRLRLARSMGFDTWDEFSMQLKQHRQQVHSHFDQVFEAPQAEQKADSSVLASVWLSSESGQAQVQLLQAAGFEEPQAASGVLQAFKNSSVLRTLTASGRVKLDQLMPLALDALAQNENPDQTLVRLVALLEAIVRRTAYINLLVENPLALSQLVRLLGESAWVGSQLQRQPILLDELLDPRRLYSPMHEDELEEELATLLHSVDEGDEEQEMERLRQFANGSRLRVAAADIVGEIPLMVVSDYLTEIAEVSLRQVQNSAWRDITARHGRPALPEGMQSGFAIIGYGKLGGVELGYGSDLDLVFLHGSDKPSANTDGPRQVANDVFFARLGQRVIHLLTTRMPSGQLYEADMRLRPNGNSGMLVSSLKAFEHYQHNDAWTWEHQALIRARAVSGDPEVIERFNEIRTEILCQARDEEQLRDDVCAMRRKMAENLDRSDKELFDIKHGPGGLVDIEFMVQFVVLRWAAEYPGLTKWTDNARLLESLTEYDLMAGHAAEQLFSAYRVYRAIAHRRALQEQKTLIRQGELIEERAMVREIWQQLMD